MNSTGDLNGPDLNPNKVLIIVGPTAIGKSAVAVAIAHQLDGEVIALDSRQIYRYMPVGTDQPDDRLKGIIPHHLYGFREPDMSISAGEYARLVEGKIDEIFKRFKQPILCGGSGLYFRALTRGLFKGSTSDLSIRKKLKRELLKKGAKPLLQKLKKIDPEYAEIVHPNNHKRLLRALEIYEITGIAPSEHFRRQRKKSSLFHYYSVYLRAPIELLEKWIGERSRHMLDSGWIEEVKSLMGKGYSGSIYSLESLGYRQIVDYLEGKINYGELVELINTSTRQYARKQLKWFDHEQIDFRINIKDKMKTELHANEIVEKLILRES